MAYYETTEQIKATELPKEERVELARELLGEQGGIDHFLRLKSEAITGTFDPTPRTFTTAYRGDSVAAALGRVYKIRDTIEQHTDANVECEPTGKEYLLQNTNYYEIRVIING